MDRGLFRNRYTSERPRTRQADLLDRKLDATMSNEDICSFTNRSLKTWRVKVVTEALQWFPNL